MIVGMLATIVPALVLPSPHAWTRPATRPGAVRAHMVASTQGSLPDMYRARWRADDESDEITSKLPQDMKGFAAKASGATLAASAIASLGAFKSIALTDRSLELTSNAWLRSEYDITPFFNMITDWVAHANALFRMPTTAEFVFALVVTVDVTALASFLFIALEMIASEPAGATEQSQDEFCVVAYEEPVCGPASFDSTEEFACIEQMINGKVQWVCA